MKKMSSMVRVLVVTFVVVFGSVFLFRYLAENEKQIEDSFVYLDTTDTIQESKEEEDENVTISNSDQKEAGLVVLPEKCIGCGKCVRIAPENFSFDYATRKAKVISQEGRGDLEVKRAIERCPADAIVL